MSNTFDDAKASVVLNDVPILIQRVILDSLCVQNYDTVLRGVLSTDDRTGSDAVVVPNISEGELRERSASMGSSKDVS